MALRMLVTTLVLAGCVSSQRFEEIEARLEECREDKSTAQLAMRSCEDRYAREVRRFKNLDEVVATVIPESLAEFRAERQRVLALVPEQARQEVGLYIDELADSLGRGFQVLRDENEEALLQLEIAQTKLDALSARTESIDDRTTTISDSLESTLQQALQRQQRVARRANALVATIHQFDASYLGDSDRDKRLRLNRHQRETVRAFHDQLVAALAGLAGAAGPDARGTDPGADRPGSFPAERDGPPGLLEP